MRYQGSSKGFAASQLGGLSNTSLLQKQTSATRLRVSYNKPGAVKLSVLYCRGRWDAGEAFLRFCGEREYLAVELEVM